MKVVLIAVLVLLAVVPTATMWTQDHEIYGEASQQIKNGVKAEMYGYHEIVWKTSPK